MTVLSSKYRPEKEIKKTKKKMKQVCPNCDKKWKGYDCKHCGFDATEIDIY